MSIYSTADAVSLNRLESLWGSLSAVMTQMHKFRAESDVLVSELHGKQWLIFSGRNASQILKGSNIPGMLITFGSNKSFS